MSLVHQQRQHVVGIGRSLDQHDVGIERCERVEQTARAAGAVVPDAEDVDSHGYSTSWHAVEVLPARPLLDDGLQVFEPHDAILHRVFDDRAGQSSGDVAGAQRAVAESRPHWRGRP